MLAANCVIKEVRCFFVRPFVRSLFVGLFVCSYCTHDIAWRLICNIVQYCARDSTCLFGILTEQARVISCMRTRYCTTCARTISHVLVRYCGSTKQARAISCTIFISCARRYACACSELRINRSTCDILHAHEILHDIYHARDVFG